jgi:hypothetical protein
MKPECVSSSQWKRYNTLFFLEHFLGSKIYKKCFGKREAKLIKEIAEYASKASKGEPFKVLEFKKGEYMT